MAGFVQEREDRFGKLNRPQPLSERLQEIHRNLQADVPCVHRVALALFDEGTAILRTFIHSSGGANPLEHYESHISEAPSLCSLIEDGRGRVVNDLSVFAGGEHLHTRRVADQGYGASYTLPLFWNGSFEAFLFFNSYRTHCFTPKVLDVLDLYGHLIGAQLMQERAALRALMSVVRTLTHVVHTRDPETGAHLDRMAHFSRLIALDLAREGTWPLTDEAIDHLFLFAPLHDVGKIAVPDRILRKPGRLDPEELEEMRRHTVQGREILDHILRNFGLESLPFVDLLRQIAEFHHECLDGSGYPLGLSQEQVPVAARIIAVADIFDALTSQRVYKETWPNDQAFAYLRQLAGTKLDSACVEALARQADVVARLQAQFRDEAAEEASA